MATTRIENLNSTVGSIYGNAANLSKGNDWTFGQLLDSLGHVTNRPAGYIDPTAKVTDVYMTVNDLYKDLPMQHFEEIFAHLIAYQESIYLYPIFGPFIYTDQQITTYTRKDHHIIPAELAVPGTPARGGSTQTQSFRISTQYYHCGGQIPLDVLRDPLNREERYWTMFYHAAMSHAMTMVQKMLIFILTHGVIYRVSRLNVFSHATGTVVDHNLLATEYMDFGCVNRGIEEFLQILTAHLQELGQVDGRRKRYLIAPTDLITSMTMLVRPGKALESLEGYRSYIGAADDITKALKAPYRTDGMFVFPGVGGGEGIIVAPVPEFPIARDLKLRNLFKTKMTVTQFYTNRQSDHADLDPHPDNHRIGLYNNVQDKITFLNLLNIMEASRFWDADSGQFSREFYATVDTLNAQGHTPFIALPGSLQYIRDRSRVPNSTIRLPSDAIPELLFTSYNTKQKRTEVARHCGDMSELHYPNSNVIDGAEKMIGKYGKVHEAAVELLTFASSLLNMTPSAEWLAAVSDAQANKVNRNAGNSAFYAKSASGVVSDFRLPTDLSKVTSGIGAGLASGTALKALANMANSASDAYGGLAQQAKRIIANFNSAVASNPILRQNPLFDVRNAPPWETNVHPNDYHTPFLHMMLGGMPTYFNYMRPANTSAPTSIAITYPEYLRLLPRVNENKTIATLSKRAALIKMIMGNNVLPTLDDFTRADMVISAIGTGSAEGANVATKVAEVMKLSKGDIDKWYSDNPTLEKYRNTGYIYGFVAWTMSIILLNHKDAKIDEVATEQRLYKQFNENRSGGVDDLGVYVLGGADGTTSELKTFPSVLASISDASKRAAIAQLRDKAADVWDAVLLHRATRGGADERSASPAWMTPMLFSKSAAINMDEAARSVILFGNPKNLYRTPLDVKDPLDQFPDQEEESYLFTRIGDNLPVGGGSKSSTTTTPSETESIFSDINETSGNSNDQLDGDDAGPALGDNEPFVAPNAYAGRHRKGMPSFGADKHYAGAFQTFHISNTFKNRLKHLHSITRRRPYGEKVFMLILLFTRTTFDDLAGLAKEGLFVPFDGMVARPIVFRTTSIALVADGSASVVMNRANVSVSADSHHNQVLYKVAQRFGIAPRISDGIDVMAHAKIDGVICGMNTDFIPTVEQEELDHVHRTTASPSLLGLLVPTTEPLEEVICWDRQDGVKPEFIQRCGLTCAPQPNAISSFALFYCSLYDQLSVLIKDALESKKASIQRYLLPSGSKPPMIVEDSLIEALNNPPAITPVWFHGPRYLYRRGVIAEREGVGPAGEIFSQRPGCRDVYIGKQTFYVKPNVIQAIGMQTAL